MATPELLRRREASELVQHPKNYSYSSSPSLQRHSRKLPREVFEKLRSDYECIKDVDRLAKDGFLLVETGSALKKGRVVFSVQEIPKGIMFETPQCNLLKKVSDGNISLGVPGMDQTLIVPVSASITPDTQDTWFIACFQSDLVLLSDDKLLSKQGACLKEQISGTPKIIHSLEDLPLETKYFTENGNIVQRRDKTTVFVGDKSITIQTPVIAGSSSKVSVDKPLKQPSSDSLDLDSAVTQILGKGLAGEDAGVLAEERAKVAALLHQSPEFPRIKEVFISGSFYHSETLTCNYEYSGSEEGSTVIRWEKKPHGSSIFSRIKGAGSIEYVPDIFDANGQIRVSITPVRADGVVGSVVYSSPVDILVNPSIEDEVENNLTMSTLMFKVLLVNGDDFQKRTILLNRTKVKIRKRRSTISKMRYCPNLQVLSEQTNASAFTLKLDSARYEFVTPSRNQRDMIVLTIQKFNEDNNNRKVHYHVQ